MNDDNLMDRIFRTLDHDSDGYLNCSEWLTGFWIFLKANLTAQTTYCFQVYTVTFVAQFRILIRKQLSSLFEVHDIDGDGYLNCFLGGFISVIEIQFTYSYRQKVQCRERRGEKIHNSFPFKFSWLPNFLLQKAIPFGQRGSGNEQTPADSIRTYRQITREAADKEVDLDLIDEDKLTGK